MSGKRHGRLYKATALVPLAVLSAAWTVNVTGLGGTTALASSTTPGPTATLPDGTPLPPAIGLDHPASVSGPQAQQISDAQASRLVDSATTSGIPAAALAAYQRAATVINAADTSCHLPWQLVAAIGRVESNHGRADGNTLNSKGISTPGIFGPTLNGRNGTTRIVDTDGGALDGDTDYDRAVGPMQFIPSTWSIVAVDADGDGQRNPQDINDAALATAVYLCSGTENLATPAGAKRAVYRYNHSWSYVNTVLGVERAYLAGDYTSVPTGTPAPESVIGPVTTPDTAMKNHPIRSSTPSTRVTTPSAPTTTAPTTTSKRTTSKPTTTPTAPKTTTPSSPKTTAPPATSVPANPVTPVITEAQAIADCEGKVLGTTLQTALGGLLGGSLSQIVTALDNLPLLGGPAAADKLQACVTSETSS